MCKHTFSLLRFAVLVFSYFHYAKCYTVYIIPYEGASCGLSEFTGDPCIVWTSVSPTVLAPSTTWIFTSGDYTITTHWLTVTSIGNFSIIGDPTAHLVCTDAANEVGAFRLTSIDSVRITNLQFTSCSGNTIRYVRSFVLTNCMFSYNPLYDNNGLEMDHSTVVIENTSFDGAITHISMSYGSSLTVISSNFTNGYSYLDHNNDGGSIRNHYSLREIIIRNSRFINNRATSEHNGGYRSRGGAIFTISNIIINGCLFDGNNANKGGAVYGGGRITVINSNFTRNSGPEGYGHFGGAIYGTSVIEATNSTFYGNQARNGGAVYSENSMLSVNSTYMRNVANEGNGGALHGGRKVTMVNSSFVKNAALGGTGGAVYVEATHANVFSSQSTFTNNNATSCGVLNVSTPHESNVTVIGSSFSLNRASGVINGGGVACIANALFTATNCNFTGNMATPNAGVLSVKNSSVDIEDSLFIKNIANANGGVLYTNEYQTNYTIRHSTFSKNMASKGAVMYARSSSNIKVNESMYTENHATNQGGVFYIRGGTLVIDTDSTFRHNTANSSGGVISACFSQVTAYGLELQADPLHPQFCSVYDEGVAVTHVATTVTDAGTTTKYEATTGEASVSTSPTNEATTGEPSLSTSPNPLPSSSPVTTARSHQGDTSSTTHTKPVVSTGHLQTIPSSDASETATHSVEFTHQSTTPKAPTTWLQGSSDTTTPVVDVESTTSATSSQEPTTDKGLIATTSETTTVSVTKDTANSPLHTLATTMAQTESQNKAESRDQNSDHTYATVSLVVSLISVAISVTICIVVLFLLRKVYQKGGSPQYYMLNKRKLRANEDDTVEVSEVSESPTRSLSEEKDTLIQ